MYLPRAVLTANFISLVIINGNLDIMELFLTESVKSDICSSPQYVSSQNANPLQCEVYPESAHFFHNAKCSPNMQIWCVISRQKSNSLWACEAGPRTWKESEG